MKITIPPGGAPTARRLVAQLRTDTHASLDTDLVLADLHRSRTRRRRPGRRRGPRYLAARRPRRPAPGPPAGPAQGRLLALRLDVTDRSAVFAVVGQAVGHFGRLDIVVNNAGVLFAGMVEEFTEAEARAQLDPNFFGALWVSPGTSGFVTGLARPPWPSPYFGWSTRPRSRLEKTPRSGSLR
ncbi:SDR family NAD(P)-dependent oxidoreductase [Pseudofrankia sp. BMG5.37]|nr:MULTISPECIES: SDR family NAD(P)-dependent oxidoreductase [unclassified Pseudofrankia]MDT3440749.1 SDR family NAD(P)-dependent oxidoreductase [Pseudofrankia sp. BMG5.37]OHV58941.1 hypothetical protein BCD48_05915 [Pseudofrankia sp. BMG5.36]